MANSPCKAVNDHASVVIHRAAWPRRFGLVSWQYLVKRILLLITVMWTAATINFFIPKLSPRDPIKERLMQAATQGGRNQTGLQAMADTYNSQFGLDQPI